MPDLSENLINEERTWEEIHEIKQLPVPMAQKRELKAQLQVSLCGGLLSAINRALEALEIVFGKNNLLINILFLWDSWRFA